MRDSFSELLTRQAVLFDGAMGTELYLRHQFLNVCYDELCLTKPELIKEVHRSYLAAGAQVLTTNSFGANRPKLAAHFLERKAGQIAAAAAGLAREVAGDDHYVAGSVGPVLSAAGVPLSDSELIEIFKEPIAGLKNGGADFIIFETFSGRRELLAAVRAAAELAMPYVASIALTDRGCTRSGELLGTIFGDWQLPAPLMVGLNCGLGPKDMLKYAGQLQAVTDLPLLLQPNAGAPQLVGDRMLSLTSPEYLATYAGHALQMGVRGLGGCCGVGPDHIANLAMAVRTKQTKNVQVAAATAAPMAAAAPMARRSSFGQKLARGEWVSSVELLPPTGCDLSKMVEKARLCQEAGIDVINIPDGPRASARCSPLVSALTIQKTLGQEVVLHLACRDRSVIGMQSDLLGAAAAGVNNILVITGDPPKLGDYPFSSAVFDIDSIGLIGIADRLNRGVDIGGVAINPATRFVIGAGADPNHLDMEREVARLHQKIAAGADYVVTQPVFDPKVLERFLQKTGPLGVPLIAGVWPLMSAKNAEFMNNEVPGVTVPAEIMARMRACKSKEEAHETGLVIAKEIIASIRELVQGVQVSAPLGNTKMAIRAIVETR